MLGSTETLELVNHFKFTEAEKPNYKTSQKGEECCSSVKLVKDIKNVNCGRDGG